MSASIWKPAYDAFLEKAMGGQYDESKHPRHPKGSAGGGKFAPKGGGGGAPAAASMDSKLAEWKSARLQSAKENAARLRDVAARFDKPNNKHYGVDTDGLRLVASKLESGDYGAAQSYMRQADEMTLHFARSALSIESYREVGVDEDRRD